MYIHKSVRGTPAYVGRGETKARKTHMQDFQAAETQEACLQEEFSFFAKSQAM